MNSELQHGDDLFQRTLDPSWNSTFDLSGATTLSFMPAGHKVRCPSPSGAHSPHDLPWPLQIPLTSSMQVNSPGACKAQGLADIPQRLGCLWGCSSVLRLGQRFCQIAQRVGKQGEALAALQPEKFYSDSEREKFCLRKLARCYKP